MVDRGQKEENQAFNRAGKCNMSNLNWENLFSELADSFFFIIRCNKTLLLLSSGTLMDQLNFGMHLQVSL